MHYLGQNAAVSCSNYHCSFKCRGARLAEERRRKKIKFRPMLTHSSRKLCVNVITLPNRFMIKNRNIFLFLIINLFGNVITLTQSFLEL